VHTSPPAADVVAAIPELAALGRTATRLHPRRGTVTAADSHLGGPVNWPVDEPWPHCESPMHDGPNPMIPLAQLRAEDIPDLPRPGGADVLWVLWCPVEHDGLGDDGPTVELCWLDASELAELPAEPPQGEVEDEYVPAPCRLHPEQVVEYPYIDELPHSLRVRVDEWDARQADGAPGYRDVAIASGWKVGGYATWGVTDVNPTPCPTCDGPTTLALVIASMEYGGDNLWRPAEEQHLDARHPDRAASQEPTGISVGRHGSLRLFVCPRCPDAPFLLNVQ
jgi:hypothetical protein